MIGGIVRYFVEEFGIRLLYEKCNNIIKEQRAHFREGQVDYLQIIYRCPGVSTPIIFTPLGITHTMARRTLHIDSGQCVISLYARICNLVAF